MNGTAMSLPPAPSQTALSANWIAARGLGADCRAATETVWNRACPDWFEHWASPRSMACVGRFASSLRFALQG